MNGSDGPAHPDSSALLVLPNFRRFCQSTEIVQALAHQIQAGKTQRTFILILSPVVQIPIELEKHFTVVEHDLPDRQQLESVARGIATEKNELPEGEDLQRLLDAAAGLTRVEAEEAFSLSLVRERKLTPQTIWELKGAALKKSSLLTLHRGGESFADLGGLDAFKSFCSRALGRKNPIARPRGILLLSPPGCGKSMFAKSLGNAVGRPTLVLDVAAIAGGGDTAFGDRGNPATMGAGDGGRVVGGTVVGNDGLDPRRPVAIGDPGGIHAVQQSGQIRRLIPGRDHQRDVDAVVHDGQHHTPSGCPAQAWLRMATRAILPQAG